jgi:dipeptidyl aminopeptidase/acylaminoacyl peptidase
VAVAQETLAPWERRFRAPVSFLPTWSPQAPERCVYASSEAGVWQLFAWNSSTGKRRQVTNEPVGVTDGTPSLDGRDVYWFADDTGDEAGRWIAQPYDGGETRPLFQGLRNGWSQGLAQAPGVVAVGLSDRDGFAVYVSVDGGRLKELRRSSEAIHVGSFDDGGFLQSGLSADGSLLCLEHAEHGDLIHPALLVIDPRSGAIVGEQGDPGLALAAKAWSPVPGEQLLAIQHEREGDLRPAIWNLATGERRDLELEVGGEVTVQAWWPDGTALLLKRLHEGRHELLRYELGSGQLRSIPTEPGVISEARVRPDGSVWLLHEQGQRQRLIRDDEGAEPLRLAEDSPLVGRPYQSWHFTNAHGDRVHGFYLTPDDSGGPFPVMMFVHGGPTWLDADRWQPEVQAYVDAGFAVGLVNYRGSTGYGREWRDTLVGNIGGPELEDVNAGLQDLVERGIADATRAVIAGYSWGGYVTLLELGKHPELWLCGIAGVPVGDYAAGYEDLSPLLQAYDRALLGAAPSEVPELMRDRNPINFVDNVRAPVLFLIGKNDSRCPYRQAMVYVERLADRGHPHEAYVFETGHSPFDIDERVRQVGKALGFLQEHVPGIRADATAGAGN